MPWPMPIRPVHPPKVRTVCSAQVTTEDGQAHAVRTSTVTVAPDEAAVFSGDLSSVGDEDEQQTGLLAATDGNGMGAPGYTVTVQPTNGSAYINEETGSWVYIPDTDFHGDDAFTVGATDDAGNVYTQEVSLTVNSVDDPASFAGQTIFTAIESESISDTLTASDSSDGMSNPGYTISENPSQGTANIDPITGEWSYEPNDGYEGFDAFTVLATDDGFTATQTISITVEPYVLDLDTNNADFNNEVIFPLGGESVALATSEGNNVLSEDLTLLTPSPVVTPWQHAISFDEGSPRAQSASHYAAQPLHYTSDGSGQAWAVSAVHRFKDAGSNNTKRMLWSSAPYGYDSHNNADRINLYIERWSSESRLTFYYGTTNAAGGYLQFDAPLETNGIDVNSAYWGYYVEYDGGPTDMSTGNIADAFSRFRIFMVNTSDGTLIELTRSIGAEASDDGKMATLYGEWTMSNNGFNGAFENQTNDHGFGLGSGYVTGTSVTALTDGRTAAAVVTTLLPGQNLSVAEIETLVLDPMKWLADYKVGEAYRQVGDATTTLSNFTVGDIQAANATQIWLMGDGDGDVAITENTGSSSEEYIKNQVAPDSGTGLELWAASPSAWLQEKVPVYAFDYHSLTVGLNYDAFLDEMMNGSW